MTDEAANHPERRIVTALFADVTGSTSMAEGLDPEDWTEIMDDAFRTMIAAVEEYGGRVTRLMGDGLLALFGAPTAHEDDPERAVSAGLRMLENIQPLRHTLQAERSLDFNIRVGLNTGLAVVGRIGSDDAADYTALGDAINVAARMEQTAQPGTLQVAFDTYRAVVDAVEADPVGPVAVKGKAEPVPAYRIDTHFPRTTATVDGSFHGRETEMASLLAVLRDLRSGLGRVAFIIGDAGLGKTRLLTELRRRAELAEEALPTTWLHSQSAPYDAQRPYSLLLQRVQQLYGLRPGASLDEIAAAIDLAHGEMRDDVRLAAIESIHAGLSDRREGSEDELQGEALKQQIKLAMIEGTALMAKRTGAVILVIDGLQWVDAASREILEASMSVLEDHPVLLLCAMRPDVHSNGWKLRQHFEVAAPHRYEEIWLGPLPLKASQMLLCEQLGVDAVPAAPLTEVLEATGGNPLFIEETALALLEAGAIAADPTGRRGWNDQYDALTTPLPASLHALLTARIDRLASGTRRVLQAAAVIGTSFTYDQLAALAQRDEVDAALAELQQDNYIREIARVPTRRFQFQQEIARQAASASMLHKDRRRLHRTVANELAASGGAAASIIARHYQAAGDAAEARLAWANAGDAALRVSAIEDARTDFERAFALVDDAATAPHDIIHVVERLGRTLELSSRHDEALELYEWLNDIGAARADQTMRAAAATATAVVRATFNAVHDPAAALDAAGTALGLTATLDDRRRRARALWARMLVSLYGTRDMAAAITDGTAALELAASAGSEEELAYIRHDLARAYLFTGDSARARALLADAAAAWERLGNLAMRADAYSMQADLEYEAGQLEQMERAAHAGLALAQGIDSAWLTAVLQNNLIQLEYERGDFAGAVERLRGIEALGSFVGIMEEAWHQEAALLHAATGATANARSVIRSLRERTRDPALLQAIEIATAWWSGDHAAALDLVRQPVASHRRAPIGLYPLLEPITAEVEATVGDAMRGLSLAREIDTRHRQRGHEPLRFHAQLAMGVALRNLGRLDKSRTTLARALSRCEEVGSTRTAWRLAAELAKTEEVAGLSDAAVTSWALAHELLLPIAAGLEAEPHLAASFSALPAVAEVMAHANRE